VISGSVNANLEAIIPLMILDSQGRWVSLDAVVDTGFTANLLLPPADIQALGIPFVGQQQAVLADGSTGLFDVHAATINWDGQVRNVLLLASHSSPLVGTRLLQGHKLQVEVKVGGAVTIEALP
jgi:clan AA aspartic protease